MSRTFLRKVLLVFVVMATSSLVVGQETKDKKAKGRLPAYYADIVNDAQKQQIYTVQEKYSKAISALQDQIAAIEKTRDTEIEALLDAQQKTKLKMAQDEGAAKKKKAAADKKAADAAKAGEKK